MTNPRITDLKEGDKVRVSFEMTVNTPPPGVIPYVEGGPLSICLTPEEAKSVRIERLD